MEALAALGISVLALFGVLVVLFVRRMIIARGRGAIEMALRLSTMVEGRGWAPGIGRFDGDELRWYRIFSFAVRPKRVLSRRDLAIESRRAPTGPELLVLPAGCIVLRCTGDRTPFEIAMTEAALTGFLSWLEAAPPGAASRRLEAR